MIPNNASIFSTSLSENGVMPFILFDSWVSDMPNSSASQRCFLPSNPRFIFSLRDFDLTDVAFRYFEVIEMLFAVKIEKYLVDEKIFFFFESSNR